MTTEIKRKLYKRGSSFETTIPMPILFALDKSKKHNVMFKFDNQKSKWYIEFEEAKEGETTNRDTDKNLYDTHKPRKKR